VSIQPETLHTSNRVGRRNGYDVHELVRLKLQFYTLVVEPVYEQHVLGQFKVPVDKLALIRPALHRSCVYLLHLASEPLDEVVPVDALLLRILSEPICRLHQLLCRKAFFSCKVVHMLHKRRLVEFFEVLLERNVYFWR
jgi:hypothetical protein